MKLRGEYFVEVYRPSFPDGGGIKYQVHKAKDFCIDVCSPCLTALFRVANVKNKDEAIALVMEFAVGKPVTVYQVIPKYKKEDKK